RRAHRQGACWRQALRTHGGSSIPGRPPPGGRLMPSVEAPRILDFDIENRPLTYLGGDFTTAEITAIACGWADRPDDYIACFLLYAATEPNAKSMLKSFRVHYDRADIVTGHYIRKHDLPIINGAMTELGLPPLGPKLTIDTKLDLVPMS